MSRIDLLTIAIVIVCVVALGLLIYNVVNITGSEDSGADNVEQVDPYDEYFDDEGSEEATLADESDISEDELDSDDGQYSEEDELDDAEVTIEESTALSNEELDESETDVPESFNRTTLGNGSGQYLVIAGNFSVKANAEKHAEKLRNLGYSNAVVEPFDRGTMNVVLVDRYDDIARARTAAKELKNEHSVSAYVQKKQAVKE